MLSIILATVALQVAEPAPAPADYTLDENWLCRPGRNDACAVDLDATVVKEDGSTSLEPFTAVADPAIDCFYVYPTISGDMTPNSDLVPGDGETRVVAAQFARFAAVCRPFAPMYRQVTLAALRARLAGQDMGASEALGYGDVIAAFDHYIAEENDGRPFVLIGHSQGTRMLSMLVKDRIDGQALQDRMLSAMLIGYNVEAPSGARVGGSFDSVTACTSPDQTGCVVTYVSFRENMPPPATSLFGRSMTPDNAVLCTNPASLAGGPATLDAYLVSGGSILSSAEPAPWVEGSDAITTPYVKVPGLLTAECVEQEGARYLAVTVAANDGPRTDTIAGDVIVAGEILQDWGLHLVDINIAQGDLIDLVRSQAAAWAADH